MMSFDKYGQPCGEHWTHPGMFIGDLVFYKEESWCVGAKEQHGVGVVVDFDGYDKYKVRWSKSMHWVTQYESHHLELANESR